MCLQEEKQSVRNAVAACIARVLRTGFFDGWYPFGPVPERGSFKIWRVIGHRANP